MNDFLNSSRIQFLFLHAFFVWKYYEITTVKSYRLCHGSPAERTEFRRIAVRLISASRANNCRSILRSKRLSFLMIVIIVLHRLSVLLISLIVLHWHSVLLITHIVLHRLSDLLISLFVLHWHSVLLISHIVLHWHSALLITNIVLHTVPYLFTQSH